MANPLESALKDPPSTVTKVSIGSEYDPTWAERYLPPEFLLFLNNMDLAISEKIIETEESKLSELARIELERIISFKAPHLGKPETTQKWMKSGEVEFPRGNLHLSMKQIYSSVKKGNKALKAVLELRKRAATKTLERNGTTIDLERRIKADRKKRKLDAEIERLGKNKPKNYKNKVKIIKKEASELTRALPTQNRLEQKITTLNSNIESIEKKIKDKSNDLAKEIEAFLGLVSKMSMLLIS